MPRLNILSMTAKEAIKLAVDAELAKAESVDGCLERLRDIRGGVGWLIPGFKCTQQKFGSLVPRLRDLAEASSGVRRVHVAMILMAFGEDFGLGIILQALEGQREELRRAAIEQLSYAVGQEWPVHYYEKLLGSSQMVMDCISERERDDLIRFCFARPGYRVKLFKPSIPVFSEFARHYLLASQDYKKQLAAMWFLCQGMDEGACRFINDFIDVNAPLELNSVREWLKIAVHLMGALKNYREKVAETESKTWAISSSLCIVNQIAEVTSKAGMPHIKSFWDDICSHLYGIAVEDFPKDGVILVRDIVLNRLHGEWIQERALTYYAYLSGSYAVDDLLAYMSTASLSSQGAIARTLTIIAPKSRYLELASHLRKIFESNYLELQFGEFYDQGEQEGLSGIACALALFDPNSASAINERFIEFGSLYGREVFWALNKYTPIRMVGMLVDAQAMDPIKDWMPHHAKTSASLVRDYLRWSERLVIVNARESCAPSSVSVLLSLTHITRPVVEIGGIFEGENGELRFVYENMVFELFMEDLEDLEGFMAVARGFNAFLCYIGHAQRVFYIDGDGAEDDGEQSAFVCANENLFADAMQKLNYPIRLVAAKLD